MEAPLQDSCLARNYLLTAARRRSLFDHLETCFNSGFFTNFGTYVIKVAIKNAFLSLDWKILHSYKRQSTDLCLKAFHRMCDTSPSAALSCMTHLQAQRTSLATQDKPFSRSLQPVPVEDILQFLLHCRQSPEFPAPRLTHHFSPSLSAKHPVVFRCSKGKSQRAETSPSDRLLGRFGRSPENVPKIMRDK